MNAFNSQAFQPNRDAAPDAPVSESVIDRDSEFDGLYSTRANVRIEGSAKGEILCEGTVTVAEQATLAAKVQARNFVLAGTATGEIVCQERFTLQPTGKMSGTVRAASLRVEEGARFDGDFQMSSNGSAPAGSAAPQATASTPQAEPTPAPASDLGDGASRDESSATTESESASTSEGETSEVAEPVAVGSSSMRDNQQRNRRR